MLMYTALQLDVLVSSDDEGCKQEADDTVALLTPIIKAFITDNG